ncbi:ArsR/SmtB family transcription factor [Rhizohabitans arisaemae]|uniref:ArsR/SmtB family transcription factor n=1 Tax=Rhizohabitans arisaemae TaxID=2720610 RepID=UPI0024B153E8|nr:metalloregulator ArsR/SmtB family transcription factor [Rhizohabitans arisaemae]
MKAETPTDSAAEDRIFAALASPVRRQVLQLLRERQPQPVTELAAHFAIARPSFSEHLRVLREAGLVGEHRVGRQRLYRLQAESLAEVQQWLHPFERFWRDRLTRLGEVLERLDDES